MQTDAMDIIRLSEDCASLLQLCAPCQKAMRDRQFHRVRGPQLKRRLAPTWSCSLCSKIDSGRLPTYWTRLKLSIPFSRKPNEWSDWNRAKYDQRPVGDINDIVLLARDLTKSTPMFNHPPVAVSEIVQSAQLPSIPILRTVPFEKIDISLVMEWISACEHSHIACRHGPPRYSINGDTQRGLILIDVKEKKLVQDTSNSRYFALSYVWGNVKQLQLRQDNFLSLQERHGLEARWKEIPSVIQDAISFVLQIGERYIWIDALCIIQDSDNRHAEIARMGEIYKRASCTLVALDCSDASNKLPGVRAHTRNIKTLAYFHGLLIGRKKPELAKILATSKYDKRAWTFQERVLSRRCLYFTSEQLYFHCKTVLWSEDRFEHFNQSPDPLGKYPSLSWPPFKDPFEEYIALVRQYTRRELSFEADRLNAFSGMANYRGDEWGWTLVFGIPLERLYEGLFWISCEYSRRIIEDPSKGKHLPSWSWVGWTGAVDYQLNAGYWQGHSNIEMIPANILNQSENTRLDPAEPLIVLAFWSEVTFSSQFKFHRTYAHGKYGVERRILRIFDMEQRACGLLFHSGLSLPGSNATMSFEFNALSLQFALLSSAPSPFYWRLDDGLIAEKEPNERLGDEDPDPWGVYDEHYADSTLDTLNVMLIEWKTDQIAERVAIGQINSRAWELAQPKTRRIFLR